MGRYNQGGVILQCLRYVYRKQFPLILVYAVTILKCQGLSLDYAILTDYITLSATVARMCKAAEIPGFRTNHSLRATTATRLYQAGVDEQLIMERTGHHSIDGVRNYKRTNAEQQENLSDILSLSKRPKQGFVQPCSTTPALVPAPVSLP